MSAEVSLDGRPLGSTPVEVPLHAGKYTVTLTAPGYGSLETALSTGSTRDQAYDYLLTAAKPSNGGGAVTPVPTQPRPTGGGGGAKKTGGGGTKTDTPTKPKPTGSKPSGGDDDLMDIPTGKKK